MQMSYLYTVCLFVVMSVILSYYYISIVGDTNQTLTDPADNSMNKRIDFKMLRRVQDAFEEEQSPRIGFDDDLMSRAIQAGNLTRLKNVLKEVKTSVYWLLEARTARAEN